MSDLISRRDLLRHLADWQFGAFSEVGFEKEYELMNDVFDCVKNMPTAYDVDKVVEELETLAEKHMSNSEKAEELGKAYEKHAVLHGGKGRAYENAIEIVRKGGVENEIDRC